MRKLSAVPAFLVALAALYVGGHALAAPPVVEQVANLNPAYGAPLRPAANQTPIPLNGIPHRWTLPDAGQSILISGSTAQACIDLTGVCSSTLMFEPEQTVNVCFAPQTGATGLNVWDGGCNAIDSDPNFGVALGAWSINFALLEDNKTNSMCAISDAGGFRIPVWCMK